MKTKIEKLPKSEMEIEIEIPVEELDIFIERVFADFSKNLKIDGFREGKIPKEVIKREIGEDKIFREAGNIAIKEKYLQVISENKIEAVSPPEIKILKLAPGNPLIFKARFPVLPEVNLPDYKKVASSCKKREIQVREEEIEGTLLQLQKSRAKFSQVERAAKVGDFVEIEFSSSQIEMGNPQKDGFLLGQGNLIPGFEKKLEGMKTGEEKDFSLTSISKHFQPPTTFQEEGFSQGNSTKSGGGLAGKTVNFKVKMKSVKKMELPEITDQFIKSLGQFEDLSSLKQNIREGLKSEKGISERQRMRAEVLERINKEINLEIPDVLIEAERNRQLDMLKKYIASQLKISFEEYLKRVQKSEADVKNSFQAEERIKNFLILREISKAENIEVSEEEVKTEINKTLRKFPDIEKAKKELDLGKLKSYYEEEIRNEKVLKLLESLIQK